MPHCDLTHIIPLLESKVMLILVKVGQENICESWSSCAFIEGKNATPIYTF